MAKKNVKTAPKERINITYRSALKPNERVELPLKILVLADVTGKPDERAFEDRKPTRIERDNFDEVLAETGVEVAFSAPNRLGDDDGGDLDVNLTFKTMKDFSPGGIAQQVPEIRKLVELREALSALKSPLGNRRDFRNKIEGILKDEGSREKLMGELGLRGETEPTSDLENTGAEA